MRQHIMSLFKMASVSLGLAFGLYFVLSSPFLHYWRLWLVWAPLVVAFTGAAGAVFPYGVARWTELIRFRGAAVRVRDTVPRTAPIGLLSLFVLAWSTWLPGPVHFSWRNAALIAVPFIGGITVAATMEGIRKTAELPPATGIRGEQTAQLIRLRQLLQRLLASLGSLVALSTLALGASVSLLRDLAERPGFRVTVLPPQFVLVFGGLGSLLVALFYIPAAIALQRRGQQLCDALFPLERADEPAAILAVAEDRHKLELLLGVDRSVTADLQTGLVILGPLISGAATAFLSP